MNDVAILIFAAAGVLFFLAMPTAFVARWLWRMHLFGRLVLAVTASILVAGGVGVLVSVGAKGNSVWEAAYGFSFLWALVFYGGCAAYGLLVLAVTLRSAGRRLRGPMGEAR